MNRKVVAYFERFGFSEQQIAEPPPADLQTVVVIPCFNEPDLPGTLQSLLQCERPAGAVEVIVVINSSADASAEILKQNRCTCEEAIVWSRKHSDSRLRFHILHRADLPPRDAGVGLARKIGMDEAIRRFDAAASLPDGVIAGLDADCSCASNYLCAIENHFQQDPETRGCSIYFEHPLRGPLPREIYQAVSAYELHLRYYVEALRHVRFPHAFHTIGSCMAVRAPVYIEQGGMNKRQAGEDFYFLHKIIPLGGFTDLTGTTVYPSPRSSTRVPFGTGKAVNVAMAGKERTTYPLEAFLDLGAFLEAANNETLGETPPRLAPFLETHRFHEVVGEIRQNTASPAAFRKRFFRWFDGFMAMKMIHFLRDQSYSERGVYEEAERLKELITTSAGITKSAPELLTWYRLRQQRELARQPTPPA